MEMLRQQIQERQVAIQEIQQAIDESKKRVETAHDALHQPTTVDDAEPIALSPPRSAEDSPRAQAKQAREEEAKQKLLEQQEKHQKIFETLEALASDSSA